MSEVNKNFPPVIEVLSFESSFEGYLERFKADWAGVRADNPEMPDYDVELLETDTPAIIGQSITYYDLHYHQRINDAIKAILAQFAKGGNLDAVVGSIGVKRLVIKEAVNGEPAIYESDERLLRRYFARWEMQSGGSIGLYTYLALTAVPSLKDVRINGRAVHGRKGDIDVVILGDDGLPISDEDKSLIKAELFHEDRWSDTISVAVIKSNVEAVDVDLTLYSNLPPSSFEPIRNAAENNLKKFKNDRLFIGGEIPLGAISAAAYVDGVVRVLDNNPIEIAFNPYTAPKLNNINIQVVPNG